MRPALARLADNLWLIMLAGAAMLLGTAAVLTWTPVAHPVHTPGAKTVSARAIAQEGGRPFALLELAPSLSLSEVRCEAWQQTNADRPCPADAVLQHFWPEVAQSARTLYFGISSFCVGFEAAASLSLEFLDAARQLLIHCVSTASWVSFRRTMPGVQAVPLTDLVLVPIGQMPPGQLSVVKDDRVEHLLGDASTLTLLGRVEI